MLQQSADSAAKLSDAGKATLLGAGVTTGSGLWSWIGTNHEQITAICAVIGAVCAVCGFAATLLRSRRPGAD